MATINRKVVGVHYPDFLKWLSLREMPSFATTAETVTFEFEYGDVKVRGEDFKFSGSGLEPFDKRLLWILFPVNIGSNYRLPLCERIVVDGLKFGGELGEDVDAKSEFLSEILLPLLGIDDTEDDNV